LSEAATSELTNEGTSQATRKASTASPVPNWCATKISFAAPAKRDAKVHTATTAAAENTWRCGERLTTAASRARRLAFIDSASFALHRGDFDRRASGAGFARWRVPLQRVEGRLGASSADLQELERKDEKGALPGR
jgi:hypothetical protein